MAKPALASSTLELKNAGFDGPPVQIPRIGLGVWQMKIDEAYSAVAEALRLGYRHIDTARGYNNEKGVGRAVRESGIPREEIFITTKLRNPDHGYEATLESFNRSLAELEMDYVDLYLIHAPMPLRLESWRAMEILLKSGKAKSIGVSNYGIHHLEELFANSSVRPSVNQIEIHPLNTRPDLVKFCQEHGIILEAYSPLTTGKHLANPNFLKIAAKYNKTSAQLLIRWSLQKNYVVLPKSVTPSRIAENSQVFDFEIKDDDMTQLDSLNQDLAVCWDPTLWA